MVIKVSFCTPPPTHKNVFQTKVLFGQLKVFHASLFKSQAGHHESGKAGVLNTEGSIRTTFILDLILPSSPCKYFPKLFVATTHLPK